MPTIKQGSPCHAANYSSRDGAGIKYIVIHYTAGDGDTAAGNCGYFSRASRGASAHYFVGEDGIYQSVPDNMRAWHCGGTSVYKHRYCRNANSIGIEMCSRKNAGGGYYIANSVVEQTIALTQYLMKKYGIPAENVLRHYDVWAKECPAPFVKYPAQWEGFKKRITESEGDSMTTEERTKFNGLVNAVSDLAARVDALAAPEMIYNYIDKNMPEWARPTIEKLVGMGCLKGNENGELGLTYDLMRALVVLDRIGILG